MVAARQVVARPKPPPRRPRRPQRPSTDKYGASGSKFAAAASSAVAGGDDVEFMCETTREERDAVLREAAEWLSIATATRASERLGVVCSCVRAKGAGVGWSVFGSVVCWAQPHAHACKHSVVHVGAPGR